MGADRTERLAIIVTAEDLAAGKLGKVRKELAGLGSAGKVAALGLGTGIVAVKKGEQALKHLGERVRSLAGPVGLIGLTGAAFGVTGALEQGIERAKTMALTVEKLTAVTGMGVHQASQYVAVFERFGIEGEGVIKIAGFAEKTLGKLSVGLGLTGTGVAKLTKLEQTYGINLHDATGKAVDFGTELGRVADYYQSNATAAQKAALAATLFGKGYTALLPILKLGSKGIAEVAAEADNLGLTLRTAEDVSNVKAFIAAQRDAKDALGGLELQLGLLVMPDLTGGLKAFTGFLASHRADVQAFFKSALRTAEGFAAFVSRTVVPMLTGLGTAAISAWNSVPAPLRDLLVKGFVAGKVTKFLFGFDVGPGGWLKAGEQLGGAFLKAATKGLATSISEGAEQGVGKSVAQGLIGKFLVQPVFVTNPGFGLAGGLPAVAPAAVEQAGAGLLGIGVAGFLGIAIAAIAPAALGGLILAINGDRTAKDSLTSRQATAAARGLNPANVPTDFGTRRASAPVGSSAITQGGFDSRFTPITQGGFDSRMTAAASTIAGAIVREESALHKDLTALRSAKTEAEIRAAAKKVGDEIATAGHGNLRATKAAAALLREKLDHTHDPKTQAALRAQLARVEAKIPGREWVQRQITAAHEINSSTKSARQKIAELKPIEQNLLKHGDTHAASQVAQLIKIQSNTLAMRNSLGGIANQGNHPGRDNADNFPTSHPTSHPTTTPALHTGARASGGPIWPGAWTFGEEGPERAYIRRDGTGFVSPAQGHGLMSPASARAVIVQLQLAVHVASRPVVGLRELQTRSTTEARYGKVAAGG